MEQGGTTGRVVVNGFLRSPKGSHDRTVPGSSSQRRLSSRLRLSDERVVVDPSLSSARDFLDIEVTRRQRYVWKYFRKN